MESNTNIHFNCGFNSPWQLFVYGPFIGIVMPFIIWYMIIKTAVVMLKNRKEKFST